MPESQRNLGPTPHGVRNADAPAPKDPGPSRPPLATSSTTTSTHLRTLRSAATTSSTRRRVSLAEGFLSVVETMIVLWPQD